MSKNTKITICVLIALTFIVVIGGWNLFVGTLIQSNFQEAQVRSKTTRSFADSRTIRIAIQNYHMNNGSYPLQNKSYTIPTVMLRPVPYIRGLPMDPFHSGPGYPSFRYQQLGDEYYMIQGRGPDGDYEFNDVNKIIKGSSAKEIINNILSEHEYDSTNGIISSGDILSFNSLGE